MNVAQAIKRLGLLPLNTMLTMALVDNQELREHWIASTKNDSIVATVRTKHIERSMLHYGFEHGYYVFNSKRGLVTSHFSRDEYLHRLDTNKYFSVVSFGKKIIFGAFHNSKVIPRVYRAIAEAVSSERDSQRKRLYRWQHWYDRNNEVLTRKLSLKQTKHLVYTVLQDYNFDLTRVEITDTWNKRNKAAIAHHIHTYESRLDMSTFMMLTYEFNHTDLGTVLHEVAHSIVLSEYTSWKGPVAGHGPEYCLILAELFHRYADIAIELTYNSMISAKLKVAPIQDFFDGKDYPFYERFN